MTKTRNLLLALAGLTVVGATAASADQVDRRQNMQERRIEQGFRNGNITRSERAALEAEQARIRAMEARARADGHIDRREAAFINRAQNEASRHINQESNDRNRRWWHRWW